MAKANYVGPYSPSAYQAAEMIMSGGAGAPFNAETIAAGRKIAELNGYTGGQVQGLRLRMSHQLRRPVQQSLSSIRLLLMQPTKLLIPSVSSKTLAIVISMTHSIPSYLAITKNLHKTKLTTLNKVKRTATTCKRIIRTHWSLLHKVGAVCAAHCQHLAHYLVMVAF